MRECKTCHVAMVDEGTPYVVPLNYGYHFSDNGLLTLVFHSAKEGRKLDILRKNNRVCFAITNEGAPQQTDTPCNSGYYYASLIGNGTVHFPEDPTEKARALSLLVKHQTGREAHFTNEQIETVCVFKIGSTDYTGKRKAKSSQ